MVSRLDGAVDDTAINRIGKIDYLRVQLISYDTISKN